MWECAKYARYTCQIDCSKFDFIEAFLCRSFEAQL